ncbi:hypothetical protein J4717_13845 [Phaeobacter sp. HS012]|uniref:hypothetical protein n=1 Tax=unclassified Phaeobacter TaxID=2621772 RepID=UPI001B372E73|nr:MULTISPECIES: hypothetical protein [unclassified Phaeobacter]MBQ4808553.1 hypothetical protein [Phaeobacter sp. HS012]MBQ4883228.1 hypothetical protein [Phaeobacter sp. HS011]
MKLSTEISFGHLRQEFSGGRVAFVGRTSFESRAYCAFKEMAAFCSCDVTMFASKEESPEAKNLRGQILNNSDRVSFLDTRDPIAMHSVIRSEFARIEATAPFDDLVIDITAFRREELLVLLRELFNWDDTLRRKVKFLYCKAADHGEWLSKNVRDVRPVIGYPGEISSFKKTHLVLLAGVEHHRAFSVIEKYEPFSISLGIVPVEQAISEEISERNLGLRHRLRIHFDSIRNEFNFSATDPTSTFEILSEITSQNSENNIVIAPFNTKISTLAAGVFALKHPEVQMCYAEVESYNCANYSQPGSSYNMICLENMLARLER